MDIALPVENRVQRIAKKTLMLWAFIVAACHICLAAFQYVIYYQNLVHILEWAGVGFFVAIGIYFLISYVFVPSSRSRLNGLAIRVFSLDQLLLVALLFCYVISCTVNQANTDLPFLRAEDLRLFDFAICILILFPLAKLLREEQARRLTIYLIHIVVILYSAFTLFALWHIFHLEVLELPSGHQAGMTSRFQIVLGSHYNLTGMIAATMFCLCIYMVVTQKISTKVFYGVLSLVHLVVVYLSNSRTVFVGVLAFVLFLFFFLPWSLLKNKKLPIRLGLSLLIGVFAAIIFWYGRSGMFVLFDHVTHYSDSLIAPGKVSSSLSSLHASTLASAKQHSNPVALAASGTSGMRKLTSLSNRTKVWLAALKVMVSSPSAFFFGVTPSGVTDALWEIGGYHVEKVAHAHNAILQVGISMGVPAMLLFVAFLFSVAVKCIRLLIGKIGKDFRYSFLFPGMILCFVVINMAESYLVGYFSVIACFFFLFCGFVDAYQYKEKQSARIEKIDNLTFPLFSPRRVGIVLLGMCFLSVCIRFLFAVVVTDGPFIVIDESLYTNIARSLAAGEGIAYRSQPVNYMYIFYPLLLVPLYLFPLKVDLYRLVQFYNIVLISSSLFPAYLFTKEFTKSRKKALVVGAFTLLMADMQMADLLMSECVVWPLSLWLIFFAYKLFTSEKNLIPFGVLVGLFTALLFWTKPGSLAMGIVLLLAALTLGEKQHVKRRLPAVLTGCIVCIGLIAFFYVLYVFVFGYEMSLLGHYNKQLTEISLRWIAAVTEFSVLQLFLFAVGCGCISFVLPYACFRSFEPQQKVFIIAFSAGLIVTAIGTAAFVDMYKWNESFTNPQLHIRYLAMFIPVMLALSITVPVENWKSSKALIPSLLVLVLFLIVPGAGVGSVRGESTFMDSYALASFLHSKYLPSIYGYIITAILVLLLLFICLMLYRGKEHIPLLKTSLLVFAVVILSHNFCGYHVAAHYSMLENFAEDAREANAFVEEHTEKLLGVTLQKYDDIRSYWLESRMRKPLQQVTFDSLLEELNRTDGIYIPFVPANQAPNINNHITPQTDTFLLGSTLSYHAELNPELDVQQTENYWFSFVDAPAGTRLFDTALFNMNGNTIDAGSQATLIVFDDSRYDDGSLSLSFCAYSDNPNAKLSIENDGVTMRIIPLTDEQDKIYRISLPKGVVTFTAIGGDVALTTYLTE